MRIPISRRWLLVLLGLAVSIAAAAFFGRRLAGSVWIGPDELGVVVARVGADLPPGQSLAKPGQKGVREEVLGTGRHWIDPLEETVQKFPLVLVSAGRDAFEEGGTVHPATPPQVGIVTSLVGSPLPEGRFLAEPGEKGIWRRALGPGKYRLNPYAHKIDLAPATVIEAGFVGVVTHLVGNTSAADLVNEDERGVLADPIPPGIYYLNPHEHRVTRVRVGYQVLDFEGLDAITFPAADGHLIRAETTIVWGIEPGDAPHIVQQFGSEALAVANAIRPQAESKARVTGSNYTSRQLVEGLSREAFQDELTRKLVDELGTKHIKILLALVRNIEVPEVVRKPIQLSKVAVEEELTNRVRTETAKVLADLNQIRGDVAVAAAAARAQTGRLFAEERSRADAAVERTRSETKIRTADLAVQAARLEAETRESLAQAESEVAQARSAAEAESLRIQVDAFGDPRHHGLWRFAEALSPSLRTELRDGPSGSSWTDLLDPRKIDFASRVVAAPGAAPPDAKSP